MEDLIPLNPRTINTDLADGSDGHVYENIRGRIRVIAPLACLFFRWVQSVSCVMLVCGEKTLLMDFWFDWVGGNGFMQPHGN